MRGGDQGPWSPREAGVWEEARRAPVLQTVASPQLDLRLRAPHRVRPARGASWPRPQEGCTWSQVEPPRLSVWHVRRRTLAL